MEDLRKTWPRGKESEESGVYSPYLDDLLPRYQAKEAQEGRRQSGFGSPRRTQYEEEEDMNILQRAEEEGLKRTKVRSGV